MGILHGRTMAVSGLLAIFAAVISLYLSFEARKYFAIAALLCAAFCLVLFLCKKLKAFRLFSISISIVIFLGVLLRGYSFYDVECKRAQQLCGEDVWVRGIVTRCGYSAGYISYYDVILTEVDGESCDIQASLCCEFYESLTRGDGFAVKCDTVSAVLGSADSSMSYNISNGVLLEAVASDKTKLYINSVQNQTLKMRLEDINSKLSDILTSNIGGEAGALASAMLLGNKSLLPDSVERDFRRSGMSHLLAVSGLHVSIVVGIFGFALLHMRINKHIRNVILIIFATAYLFVLGFPISAIRSVIMVSIVYIVYYAGELADGISSLGVAVCAVLIVSPAAILDLGFILSFSATLGIVVFMPVFQSLCLDITRFALRPFKKKNPETRRKSFIVKKTLDLVYWLVGIFLSSFCAMLFTLLPITLSFGELSLLSIESNFLATFLVSPFLLFSLLCLLFSSNLELCELFADFSRWFGNRTVELSRSLSERENAVISLSNDIIVAVVLAISAIVLVLLIINFKHKKWGLIIPLHYPLILLALFIISSSTEPLDTKLSVLSIKGDEELVINQGYSALICDYSDGSYSDLRRAVELAAENGATEIRALMMSHYHKKHQSSIQRLLQNETVENLLMPYPQTLEDSQILEELLFICNENGTEPYLYREGDELILLPDVALTPSIPQRLQRSTPPICWLDIRTPDGSVFYLGKSAWEADEGTLGVINELMSMADCVLFGAHGAVEKEYPALDVQTSQRLVFFDRDTLLHFLGQSGELSESILALDGVLVSPEKLVYVID